MSPGYEWIGTALALFREACELPPGQRPTFLERACGQDAVLRSHVEAMLARDSEIAAADAMTPLPVRAALAELAGDEHALDAAPLPGQIGGYRVVRFVAEGGMGVVYEAERRSSRGAGSRSRSPASAARRASALCWCCHCDCGYCWPPLLHPAFQRGFAVRGRHA